MVIGIEADAQYLDFGRNRNSAFLTGGALAPGYYVTDPRGLSSLDYFGTVRGRLGYAFDRTLVYGTGGFAYGSGSADRSFGGFAGNDSFRTGYAVGGGIEYALPTDSFLNFFRSSAVTLKVEGLYVNLDRNTRNQGAFVINAANNFPGRLQRHRTPLRRVRRRPRRPELQVRLVLRSATGAACAAPIANARWRSPAERPGFSLSGDPGRGFE